MTRSSFSAGRTPTWPLFPPYRSILRVLVSSNGTRRRINPRINRLLGNDWRPASGWLLFCHFADGRWLGTHFGHHIAREFLATVISDINQLIWMPSTVRRCHVMGGRPFHSPSSHGNTCQHFHTSAQCKQTEKKTVYSWLFVWVGYDDLHTNRGRLKRKKWSKCLKFDWISNRFIPFDSSWKTLNIFFWTQTDQTKNVAAKSRKQHLSTCAPPCARIFSGRFTAERLFRSNWSQKKSVRASSKLSIGVNRNFIRIFLTLEKEKWIFR